MIRTPACDPHTLRFPSDQHALRFLSDPRFWIFGISGFKAPSRVPDSFEIVEDFHFYWICANSAKRTVCEGRPARQLARLSPSTCSKYPSAGGGVLLPCIIKDEIEKR